MDPMLVRLVIDTFVTLVSSMLLICIMAGVAEGGNKRRIAFVWILCVSTIVGLMYWYLQGGPI